MNFVGDVILAAENGDDGFWYFNLFAYETPQEYFFEKMYPMFSSDDYTVVNCENVFTDDPDPTRREKEGDEAYWYYSGTQNAQILAKGSVELYSGNDDQVVPILALGGRGVISVLSNVAPSMTHEMVSSWMAWIMPSNIWIFSSENTTRVSGITPSFCFFVLRSTDQA